MKRRHFFLSPFLALLAKAQSRRQISGVYPHLAMFNSQGECGTGAVVPWAGKLWVVTYSPHMPAGSDDKLYEIDAQLDRVVRPESIGGTPANRMIHRESNQLFIGPMRSTPRAVSAPSRTRRCSAALRATPATSQIRPARSTTRRWRKAFTRWTWGARRECDRCAGLALSFRNRAYVVRSVTEATCQHPSPFWSSNVLPCYNRSPNSEISALARSPGLAVVVVRPHVTVSDQAIPVMLLILALPTK